MDYYRLSIPIPKRPWQWLRFRISTVLLLIAIIAILLSWRRDHLEQQAEIHRLQYPYPHYQASQVTGAPNAETISDSPRSWCPATTNSGSEWLLLTYDAAVVPTSIVVHENSVIGAVVRITHCPTWGPETTLWEGTDSPIETSKGAVSTMPATARIKTNRIKVYFDTTNTTGWIEIDAVGLVDANGKTSWATGSKASSTWGEPRQSQLGVQFTR
jgi:hypothetical protein